MVVNQNVVTEVRQAQVEPVSAGTVVAYTVAGVLLFGWFLFGWLVQRQGFVASVGETAGTGFGLLLLVAVVGTVRRSRR
ncbi:hypothetical protein QTQ03_22485 [Micromonospora sp. WMMA1363]|uniref:hypothetical protein n=1 Tax=Micromonospora sp. WMMA1363 TaxID=3053985 RepID=UPI00259CB886|nr:hypothetical protein [Micromonospora sp. WMMA1363]MDM4722219.1 hypothetical protein [Micromonospora sp. WMMA1363]